MVHLFLSGTVILETIAKHWETKHSALSTSLYYQYQNKTCDSFSPIWLLHVILNVSIAPLLSASLGINVA